MALLPAFKGSRWLIVRYHRRPMRRGPIRRSRRRLALLTATRLVLAIVVGATSQPTITAPSGFVIKDTYNGCDGCCGSRRGARVSVAGCSDGLGCGCVRERRYRCCYSGFFDQRRYCRGDERRSRARRAGCDDRINNGHGDEQGNSGKCPRASALERERDRCEHR